MVEHLFLYGTLRPGLTPAPLEEVVGQLRRVGSGFVRGRLYDLGPYPGAIPDPSADTRIVGEGFSLTQPKTILSALDAYESYHPHDPDGSLYLRVTASVTLDNGRQLDCLMYVYNRDPRGAMLVEKGDYREWKRRQTD